jgi:hypothetical protein
MLKSPNRLKGTDILTKAEAALRKCLEPLPFVRSVSFETEPAQALDFMARIDTTERQKTIIGEVTSEGQPRFARAAANQLLLSQRRFPDSYPVLAAPFISTESARILKEAGVGYVDMVGNCFLSFDNVFIRIEGNPNPFPTKRDLKSIFSPRSSRVLRVMLNAPPRPWKVEELRKETDISIGLVANVRKILLDREWAAEGRGGLTLTKPKELLEQWASEYSYRQNEIIEYYSLNDLSSLETKLADFCVEKKIIFALTMFSGAAYVAPSTRFNRLFGYVDGNVSEIKDAFNLRPVGSGSNVVLLKPYDAGVFYGIKSYRKRPVVSPVQLYLDLKGYKGRGEEAAEFVLSEVLEKIWSQGKTTTSGK